MIEFEAEPCQGQKALLEEMGFRLHDTHPDFGRCTWLGPEETTFDMDAGVVPDAAKLVAELIKLAAAKGEERARNRMRQALGL
jgi:hypothetical protein